MYPNTTVCSDLAMTASSEKNVGNYQQKYANLLYFPEGSAWQIFQAKVLPSRISLSDVTSNASKTNKIHKAQQGISRRSANHWKEEDAQLTVELYR